MPMKETGEICAVIEASATAIARVREDGKLTLDDLFKVWPLVELGKDAIKDGHLALQELRDAAGEEREAAVMRFALANFNFFTEATGLVKMIMNLK